MGRDNRDPENDQNTDYDDRSADEGRKNRDNIENEA